MQRAATLCHFFHLNVLNDVCPVYFDSKFTLLDPISVAVHDLKHVGEVNTLARESFQLDGFVADLRLLCST